MSGNIIRDLYGAFDPVTGALVGFYTLTGTEQIGVGGSSAWGSITGTLSSQTDLNTALDLKANLASPTLTGVPAAPTAVAATNTTQLATTAHVFAERSNTFSFTNKTYVAAILSGITTSDGATVTTANAMAALTIDTSKGLNTKTISTDSTFLFSATPATNAWFDFALTNSSVTAVIATIPSSTPEASATAITTVTVPGSSTIYLSWRYTGSAYQILGAPFAGKHMIPFVAASMAPSVTGGCAALAAVASAANQPDIRSLDFDATTEEYAQFSIPMPESWNEGTLTFMPIWSHAATATNFGVVWNLQAVAISDDDPIAVAYGTAVTSTDTGGTTNDVYVGPESAAMTVSGTPLVGDTVFFRIARVTANASDTMTIDARLHGIRLYYTANASHDA